MIDANIRLLFIIDLFGTFRHVASVKIHFSIVLFCVILYVYSEILASGRSFMVLGTYFLMTCSSKVYYYL